MTPMDTNRKQDKFSPFVDFASFVVEPAAGLSSVGRRRHPWGNPLGSARRALQDRPRPAPQRTRGVAQQAGPAHAAGVQRNFASVADHRFGHAEDVVGRNPVAAFQRGIGDGEDSMGSHWIVNQAMGVEPAMDAVQDDGTRFQRCGGHRPDAQNLPIADGGIHARSMGAKGHRRLLAQERFNDLLGVGHDG